ncbi:MAG: PKD domain-containing protein [Bacteroidales bacterium]
MGILLLSPGRNEIYGQCTNNPYLSLHDTDTISPFSNCDNSPSLSNPTYHLTLENTTIDTAAINSYQIDWGDGQSTNYTSDSFPVSHTYNSLGLYTLTFSATDTSGCQWDTIYKIANQSNPAVGISSLGYTQGCAPQTFQFVLSQYQNNSPGTYYIWDFGDGTSTITWNYNQPFLNDTITHTYTTTSCQQANNYFTVSVTAYNECDHTTATVSNIRIYEPPDADISLHTDTVCTGTSVSFQNYTSTGFGYNCNSTATYFWDFGDPTSSSNTSTLKSPSHTYNQSGTYTVVMTADNGVCGAEGDSLNLVVLDPAVVDVVSDTSEICKNGIVQFTNYSTGSDLGYQWSVSPSAGYNNLSGSLTDSNLTVQFVQEGTFDITLTASNKCSSTDTTISIQVNDSPEADISSIGDFCAQGSINPTAQYNNHGSPIQSTSWLFPGGTPSSSSQSQPGTINYSKPGAYQVIVGVTNSCGSNYDTIDFTIHPLPSIQITALQDSICRGDSLLLTASGGDSYSWTPNSSVLSPNDSSTLVNPDSSTLFMVSGTDIHGCVNTDSFQVSVNDLPDMTLYATADTICQGDTAIVWAQGAYSYSFHSDANLTPLGLDSVLLSPSVSSNIQVTGTNQRGCSVSDSLTVTVNPPPPISIYAPTTEICKGDSVTLTASGAMTYQWYSNNNLISSSSTYQASPQTTTTYTLVAYDNAGCRATDTITITVHDIPATTATASIDSICAGQSVLLSSSGAQYYTWTPGASLNTSTGDTVTAAPTTTTTYYVTGTNTFGCQHTDSLTIQVNQSVQLVTTPSSTTICQGDTAMLTVDGATTYSWQSNSSIVQNLDDTIYVNPSSSTNYIVTGSDPAGCTHTVSIPVSVQPTPSIQANSSASSVCDGDSISLWASGAQNYQWFANGNLLSTQSQFTTTPQNSTSYTVTGTDSLGCSNTSSVTVSVNQYPTLSVSISDSAICQGNTTTITASGADNYSWAPSSSLSSSTGNSVTASPSTTTTYYLNGSSSNGCVTQDSIKLFVSPLPAITLSSSANSICRGDTVNLTATGGLSYSWNHSTSTASSIWLSPDSTKTYQVTGIDSNGCHNQASKSIVVHDLPDVDFTVDSILCLNSSINISNNSSNASTFLWDMGDNSQYSVASPNHSYSSTGYYTITLAATSNHGCVDSTKQTTQIIDVPTADFTFAPDSGCAPLNVQYNNLSSGNYLNYQWDLGNGITSQSSSPPQNSYSGNPIKDTSYMITLNVSNKCGSDTRQDSVLVKINPEASFGMSANYGCSPLNIQFANNSTGSPLAYSWDFGDGATATGTNPGTHTFQYHGSTDTTYYVTLIAYNNCGQDTFTSPITVRPQSVDAFFTPSISSGCAPLSIDFSNYSTPNSVYEWDFDDGNISSSLNPTHTFINAGTYDVKLIVSDTCSSDTITHTIHVSPPPVADFSSSKDTICAGETVNFTNLSVNPANISWDFDDGSSSNLTNPSHTYTNSGTYDVKMIIQEQGTLCYDSIIKTVYVSPGATAGFSTSALSGCVPLNINVYDSSQGAVYYQYDFDNGSAANIPSPSTVYTQDGQYKIWQVVENNFGCRDSAQINITAHPKPLSDFSLPSTLACDTPAVLKISNQSIGAGNYDWNFGNNGSSTMQHPQVTYDSAGVYKITLIASNMYQCSDTSSQTFKVSSPPELSFNMKPEEGCQPLQVQFINNSSNLSQAYWSFGDGNTANKQNPTHTYQGAGSYSIELIGENSDGCRDTIVYPDTVVVHPIPFVHFKSKLVNSNTTTGEVAFTSSASPNVVSWFWDFDDGNTDTIPNPVHQFTSMRMYHVFLEVMNQYGCINDTTISVDLQTVRGLFVPNAIAPENLYEGVSKFQPQGKNLKNYWIGIYDKWGNLIWESRALEQGIPSEAWDGRYKGSLVPPGVYVWKAKAIFEDGHIWKGMPGKDGEKHTSGQLQLIR